MIPQLCQKNTITQKPIDFMNLAQGLFVIYGAKSWLVSSIGQRTQIQAPDPKLERIIPRVTPRRVQVQASPDAILKVDVGADEAGVILPLGTGEDLSKGGDYA